MSNVICQISISLDGFVAGPRQSRDQPLGEGGEQLHEWAVKTDSWRDEHGLDGGVHDVDAEVVARSFAGVGAYVMGRNMFAGPGPWDPQWRGWWGDDPPFHAPVFVLTRHPREPLQMDGGTSFTFVGDGVEAALAQARAAAGDGDVMVAGGAQTVRQFLAAGLLERLQLHIAPVILGRGERLFEDVGRPALEPVEVVASPAATHVTYRIGPGGRGGAGHERSPR